VDRLTEPVFPWAGLFPGKGDLVFFRGGGIILSAFLLWCHLFANRRRENANTYMHVKEIDRKGK